MSLYSSQSSRPGSVWEDKFLFSSFFLCCFCLFFWDFFLVRNRQKIAGGQLTHDKNEHRKTLGSTVCGRLKSHLKETSLLPCAGALKTFGQRELQLFFSSFFSWGFWRAKSRLELKTSALARSLARASFLSFPSFALW